MAFANQLAAAPANTAFVALGEQLFGGSKDVLYGLFTDTRPCAGTTFSLSSIGPIPRVREIIGSRRYASMRLYAHQAEVRRWGPDALEIPSLQVERNINGEVTRMLSDYLNASAAFMEDPVTEFLLSNPVGIDRVSLLNNAHPYAYGGGTWDNLTTDALDATSFDAGVTAISSLQLENGKNAGFRATHLIVGPSLRKMAFDLTGSVRLAGLAGTGAVDSGTRVAAGVVPNYIQGDITPVVNPYFVGTQAASWILMDLRPGIPRPIMIGEALAPRATAVTSPESAGMVDRSVYRYYAEAQAALLGCSPFGMYGKIG